MGKLVRVKYTGLKLYEYLLKRNSVIKGLSLAKHTPDSIYITLNIIYQLQFVFIVVTTDKEIIHEMIGDKDKTTY